MAPRTIEDLKIVLERQDADLERVAFGDDFRNRDDVVCIRHYLDGWRPPSVDVWETFYWERGKTGRRTFETEAEACAYFLSWVETLPWAWRKVSP